MKSIRLPSGVDTFVDDEDYDYLMQFNWQERKGHSTSYVKRSSKINNRGITNYMHREIMKPGPGLVVDHIDGNGLNNCKSNLRIATHRDNLRNSRGHTDSEIRFKGVTLQSRKRKYLVRIRVDNKDIYLGLFEDEIQAAKAYNEAAIKYFGEFARLNKIPGEEG
jgi:hypothetical protein